MILTNKHPKQNSVIGKRKQAFRLTIAFAFVLMCLFGFVPGVFALPPVISQGASTTGTVDEDDPGSFSTTISATDPDGPDPQLA